LVIPVKDIKKIAKDKCIGPIFRNISNESLKT